MSYRCFEVSKFAERDSIESFYVYFLPRCFITLNHSPKVTKIVNFIHSVTQFC